MTNKYLGLNGTVVTQTTPAVVGGSGSAGQIPALNSSGVFDSTMMPPGVGADQVYLLASEAISAGAMVNVWNNSGTANARNADQTATGKAPTGFVTSSLASAASGNVIMSGIVTGLTGLTPGSIYYLGTAGTITLTPTTATGNVLWIVGQALSATTLQFQPEFVCVC